MTRKTVILKALDSLPGILEVIKPGNKRGSIIPRHEIVISGDFEIFYNPSSSLVSYFKNRNNPVPLTKFPPELLENMPGE